MSVFPGGSAFGYIRPKVSFPHPLTQPRPYWEENMPVPFAEAMDISSFLCNQTAGTETDTTGYSEALSTPKRFSAFNAAKETVKGIFRPLTTILKHPVKSAFTIGATIAIATAAPITIPVMVLAGLGFGAAQTIRGVRTAAREYANGNFQASENAFGDIGEGVSSVLSSLLGVRNAGAIAAESKASLKTLNPATTAFDKMDALEKGLLGAKKIQAGSWGQAFQETLSVASPQGLKTLGAQLNPVRLASIAKGKARHWAALFRESPVADLDTAIRKAQAYLKIPNSDMPKVVPELKLTLPNGQTIDKTSSTVGFYAAKTHTLHIQPDRLKALQDLLAPALDRLVFLKRFGLPRPVQNAIGNRYKLNPTIEEVAVHELTHARQFRAVSRLSPEQARQTLKDAYPNQTDIAIDTLLDSLSLSDTATEAANLAAAEKQLLSYAKLQFSNRALLDTFLENPDILNLTRLKQGAFRNYVRSGHEIEARQNAAEALLQAVTQKLGQTENLFETRQLLQQARAMLIEARLNKLMSRINALEEAGKTATATAYENTMRHWANLANLQFPRPQTAKYLKQETRLEQVCQQAEHIMRAMDLNGQAKPNPMRWYDRAKSLVAGLFQQIAYFFTPAGIRQAEQSPGLAARKHLILNSAIHYQRATQ